MSDVLALYRELQAAGVSCFDWELGDEIASTIELNDKYALFIDTSAIHTKAEETVVVAHEAGHIITGSTHRVCSPYDLIEKHEHKANAWSYNRLLTPEKLEAARRAGCRECWEVAEFLDLPQDYVEKGVEYLKTQIEPAS